LVERCWSSYQRLSGWNLLSLHPFLCVWIPWVAEKNQNKTRNHVPIHPFYDWIYFAFLWYFEHRFLFIAILPGCVLAAFGIAKINHFAERKFRWKTPVGLVLIFLYIASFGLGKNIKKRDTDKVIFRQIANYISANEHSPKQAIPVLTSDSSLMRLVPFYVNLGVQEGFCPTESVKELRNFDAIVKYAEKHNVKYFLWNERHWSKTEIDIHSDQFHHAFTPQGHWFHEECGEIILFHRD